MATPDLQIMSGSAFRLTLGLLQIAGASASLYLLVETGVTTASLIAVVLTCVLTTVSVLLRLRSRERGDR